MTNPSVEVKAIGLERILKLQFRPKADLQGRLTKVTPGQASQSGKIHPVKEMPRLVEAKANAPERTLRLHFRRKARLQERVPQNDENRLPRWLQRISHTNRGNIGSLCLIQHPSAHVDPLLARTLISVLTKNNVSHALQKRLVVRITTLSIKPD